MKMKLANNLSYIELFGK